MPKSLALIFTMRLKQSDMESDVLRTSDAEVSCFDFHHAPVRVVPHDAFNVAVDEVAAQFSERVRSIVHNRTTMTN